MKYIYTFYAWTVGIFFFIIIALISIVAIKIISPEKYTPIFRLMMQFLLFVLFIRVEVNGKEHIKQDKTYLYMPNHVSFLDAVVLTAFLPKHTIAIEEKRNLSYPVYGWLNSVYGNIPIDRKSIMGSRRSFEIAREKLEKGQNLIIFPEGGRTLTGKLKPFKKMLFKTAHEAGQPIIPIGMNGIYEMNKKGSSLIYPHKVILNFGNEIPSEIVQKLKPEQLMPKVREGLLKLLEEKYK